MRWCVRICLTKAGRSRRGLGRTRPERAGLEIFGYGCFKDPVCQPVKTCSPVSKLSNHPISTRSPSPPTPSIRRPSILPLSSRLRPRPPRLRPPLDSLRTQHLLLLPLQPALLPHHLPNLEILLPALPAEHTSPPCNSIPHHLPRSSQLPFPVTLLRSRQLPYVPHVPTILHRKRYIRSNVGVLRPSQIRIPILSETPRNETSCCVLAGEDGVAASRAVDARVGGDVVDCAVEG